MKLEQIAHLPEIEFPSAHKPVEIAEIKYTITNGEEERVQSFYVFGTWQHLDQKYLVCNQRLKTTERETTLSSKVDSLKEIQEILSYTTIKKF